MQSDLNELTENKVCHHLLGDNKLTTLMLNACSQRLEMAPPEV